ncbi:hypothetical protein TVAG_476410 [Trichomonas vaginalis G3]|uniref:DUF3447 domain-containing protein n=1 Tax=Trichomonas vaginalis (strain ATCC PRA-98 / G3) TaxID=412133 RepID=A2DA64_TRIV3|nr:protein of unknown function (DUF3447) [Trichomonas vaginalis G3]EAY22712.1 hypothetical protein TVAG_476410 [Trichomonas vaginalis G3]KAI5525525.1 protein of unknown function (DUF3447) [Trichomonas vaginalis G3]|eukprot:XP_001583698.1 hypothetical protein [Trichomonas vaginalis G3]
MDCPDDDHLLYNELTERYKTYLETCSSFMRIKTTKIDEIQKIYQMIKTNLLDMKIFSPQRIYRLIFTAYKYNNEYLKSYFTILKLTYEEFQIKPNFFDNDVLEYFFYKEYNLPIDGYQQKIFEKYENENYSLDIHEKNTIYRSIMDDDKDSFVKFIEDESFDKDQILINELYPISDEGLSLLELCCYHGSADCFKLLITKFKSEITLKCLWFSFLGGNPEIIHE